MEEVNKILEENNRILTETIDENEGSFKIVRENSSGPNIFETKRTFYSHNKDGTIKKTVLSEQMARVTRRKVSKRTSEEAENEDPEVHKITGEGERKHAKVVQNVLKHLAGKNFETMAIIIAKLVDKAGTEFADILTKHSKEIQQRFKFSPEQTAALISGTRTGDNVWAKFRTASNKTLGFNTLASHKKVKQVRKDVLPIHRELWEEGKEMLYKNKKKGSNIRKQTETAVLKVKNLRDYIEIIAQSEKENLSHLKDGETLKLCYDADAGGGRFVAEFTFLNCKN